MQKGCFDILSGRCQCEFRHDNRPLWSAPSAFSYYGTTGRFDDRKMSYSAYAECSCRKIFLSNRLPPCQSTAQSRFRDSPKTRCEQSITR